METQWFVYYSEAAQIERTESALGQDRCHSPQLCIHLTDDLYLSPPYSVYRQMVIEIHVHVCASDELIWSDTRDVTRDVIN